jgi:hypothetical protein
MKHGSKSNKEQIYYNSNCFENISILPPSKYSADRIYRAYRLNPLGIPELYKVAVYDYGGYHANTKSLERTYFNGVVYSHNTLYDKENYTAIKNKDNKSLFSMVYKYDKDLNFLKWELRKKNNPSPFGFGLFHRKIESGVNELSIQDKFELNLRYGTIKHLCVERDKYLIRDIFPSIEPNSIIYDSMVCGFHDFNMKHLL